MMGALRCDMCGKFMKYEDIKVVYYDDPYNPWPDEPSLYHKNCWERPVKFVTKKLNKCICQITALEIPPGLDAEDVCASCDSCSSCPKRVK